MMKVFVIEYAPWEYEDGAILVIVAPDLVSAIRSAELDGHRHTFSACSVKEIDLTKTGVELVYTMVNRAAEE